MDLEPGSIIGWLVSFDMDASGDDLYDALPEVTDLADCDEFFYNVYAIRTQGCEPGEHEDMECDCWDPEHVAKVLVKERSQNDVFYRTPDEIEDEYIRSIVTKWLSTAA
ncbi:hypothetical protein F5972_10930 [Microbispora cellulosiformans]|uniref:Uncharacterized protein n=1 Tax=Microbispora cellulosiformans TaxID=2614688 RepID=A0A5J5K9N2_9ACTN|nr:hypothetical protein [Microbispora cellulosiformans]KAA9380109.1 hypothetical protein F5972_10930 [Microbispora cellulosiformans]